jgi:hypothetical protein
MKLGSGVPRERELYVMLNESRARGNNAALACRQSSSAICWSISACRSVETCCIAVESAVDNDIGWGAGGVCATADAAVIKLMLTKRRTITRASRPG